MQSKKIRCREDRSPRTTQHKVVLCRPSHRLLHQASVMKKEFAMETETETETETEIEKETENKNEKETERRRPRSRSRPRLGE